MHIVRIATYVVIGFGLVLFAVNLLHTSKSKPSHPQTVSRSAPQEIDRAASAPNYVARLQAESVKRDVIWEVSRTGDEADSEWAFFGWARPASQRDRLLVSIPHWQSHGRTQQEAAENLLLAITGPPNHNVGLINAPPDIKGGPTVQ